VNPLATAFGPEKSYNSNKMKENDREGIKEAHQAVASAGKAGSSEPEGLSV
jgi:hypothetical protein